MTHPMCSHSKQTSGPCTAYVSLDCACALQTSVQHDHVRGRHASGACNGSLKALYLILQTVPLLAECFQLDAHAGTCRLHTQRL